MTGGKNMIESMNKILDMLATSSNEIEHLYLTLAKIECEQGIDSDFYRLYYAKLVEAVALENFTISDCDFSYDMYCYALKYFERLEKIPVRLISKIKNSKDYIEKEADSLPVMDTVKKTLKDKLNIDTLTSDILNIVKSLSSYYRNKRLSEIERHNFFELIYFLNEFSFIDSDLENLSMEERRRLINIKYGMYSTNSFAESIFLGKDYHKIELAKDDRLAISSFGVSEEEYMSELKTHFSELVKGTVLSFKEDQSLCDRVLQLVGEYSFRSAIFELGEDSVKNIFMETKEANNIDNPILDEVFSSSLAASKNDIDKTDRNKRTKSYKLT